MGRPDLAGTPHYLFGFGGIQIADLGDNRVRFDSKPAPLVKQGCGTRLQLRFRGLRLRWLCEETCREVQGYN
jgi:hypothetical protein